MIGRSHRSSWMTGVGAILAVFAAWALSCGNASASTPRAGWEATAEALPSHLAPGGSGVLLVNVFNIGAADSAGPVTVTDVLPPGLTATDAGAYGKGRVSHEPQLWDCKGTTVVACTSDPFNLPSISGGAGVPESVNGTTPPIAIAVKVAPEAAGTVVNRISVAGGGALTTAATTNRVTLSSEAAHFGIAEWDAWFSNEDGTIDTQAGSHPYSATFDVNINTITRQEGKEISYVPPTSEELRNVTVELPPGFVGNPQAVPQCPREDFDEGPSLEVHCPADTQIGVSSSAYGGQFFNEAPVYNLVPPPGSAALFGFTFVGNSVFLRSSPRTGGDYGIDTRTNNVPQGREARGAAITLWGVPGDPSHNAWRCIGHGGCAGGGVSPFLTLPTACGAPQPFRVHVSEWQNPSVSDEATLFSHDENDEEVGFTGCEHLGFEPTLSISPDTTQADSPAGLTVEVKPSVGGLTSQHGLSTADIQNTTVTLPEGLNINPGQAAGLAACQPDQDGVGTEGPSACPPASKVGTVQITTPLLKDKLEGNVFVLQSDPPELELLVAASADGVNLKLVGHVHLDEATGRLTSTFSGTPELPFTDFKLAFSGGAQAALTTPTACGLYTATSDFGAWSSPFIVDAFPQASFAITGGPGGSACPSSPLPFGPSMTAGSTTDQAGGFTDFSLLLQREDGQQRIEKLQFKAPQGLSGMISSVPLCQEPQAAEGTCPAASHIGHAVVASGPGPYPLVLPQPGKPELPIYLTGPYKGAPFGLSIVTPVLAGPFNLGTIITRAKIEIDPTTAQITITTDPLPQIVKGVPTDLRSIDSVIDRPGFMFNPTNCNSQEFSGTATSAGGAATAQISSHFGVGSCRSLEFHPKIAVTTIGQASKNNGTSLKFKISYPKGAQGSESWFNEAKFESAEADSGHAYPRSSRPAPTASSRQIRATVQDRRKSAPP